MPARDGAAMRTRPAQVPAKLLAARNRHAAEFVAMAERRPLGRVTGEDRWSAVLEAEHDNLRAALDLLRADDFDGISRWPGPWPGSGSALVSVRGREHS